MRKIIPKNTRLIPNIAKQVFEGVIFDVYQWQQALYDGSQATFERIKRPDTVFVIAVVNDKIIVDWDEQPGRDVVVTLPGGRVEADDDSTLSAAKRELLEETGYGFDDWRLVDVVQPDSKMEYFIYIYLAQGEYKQQSPQRDAGERIDSKLLSFEEVKQLIDSGGARRLAANRCLVKSQTIEEVVASPEFEGEEVGTESERESP